MVRTIRESHLPTWTCLPTDVDVSVIRRVNKHIRVQPVYDELVNSYELRGDPCPRHAHASLLGPTPMPQSDCSRNTRPAQERELWTKAIVRDELARPAEISEMFLKSWEQREDDIRERRLKVGHKLRSW